MDKLEQITTAERDINGSIYRGGKAEKEFLSCHGVGGTLDCRMILTELMTSNGFVIGLENYSRRPYP